MFVRLHVAKSILLPTAVAIVTGVLIGFAFSRSYAGHAEAADGSLEIPVPIAWKDLRVVYMMSSDPRDTPQAFSLSRIPAETNLQIINELSELQQGPIDVLVFDHGSLDRIEPSWASTQMRASVGFVALNVSPAEMATLLGIPSLAKTFDYDPLGNSMLVVQVTGDTQDLQRAIDTGDLFINEVPRVSWTVGYVNAENWGLLNALETIRH
ncbi:MAG: hypothetical protein IT318_07675 [Anaerolineales bacterium]|nr:hypothetical protein [Anaerolineales bacterium]